MKTILSRRNKAFINQCKLSADILRFRGRKPSVEQIVSHALMQPAPEYFVNFYRAKSILKDSESSPDSSKKRASADQYADMAADLADLISKRPGVSRHRLILELCTGRAGNPRFYISRRRALEIALAEGIA